MQSDGVLLDQMVDTGGVGDGCPADDAVDLVALLQKELCQIGTILTGDTGNQCNFRHILTSTYLQLFIYEVIHLKFSAPE